MNKSLGSTIIHNSEVSPVKGYPRFVKLDYFSRLNAKEYHDHMNNPIAGVSFTYLDHDNALVGRSYALSGFLQPIIKAWGKSEVSYKVSLGLAYVENPFDPVKNDLQKAIGSNVNYFVEAQLVYNYSLTDKLGLNAHAGLTHISNAARRLPNSGLNIVFAGFGVNYQIAEENPKAFEKVNQKTLDYKLERINHAIYIRSGVKSIRALDFAVFPAYGINYTSSYRYSPIGSWTAGLDLDYNVGYIRERQARVDEYGQSGSFDRWRTGFAVGHDLHMNKLVFVTQFATYLKRPDETHKLFYQRYGLKYHLSSNWQVAATLKAHGGRADYMEWTLGYVF
ncbi:acyloxyacyl hydrolase [Belliella sp. R4-6]|uniref:Acyloxyacyl hydrolase n=1 Tax=Belliella alkalica TaxID=1730871 RepID=A0ABS9V930_9BACT|nr:acyloxyacyl hydrolase [Belliella alkalica]MCH7412911.1 acyloxyacyl hydrolase [Belliella alkalica]